ncbi:MAG: hypothetical protein WCX22_04565 [Methanoregula sp.]
MPHNNNKGYPHYRLSRCWSQSALLPSEAPQRSKTASDDSSLPEYGIHVF